ncbi:(2Fe-2S) ferredoxin domain-containing protein [Streptomyces katsurahamanus]|uniref:(2Fe-2S) ferredoxin domain-containing protein n=1 Tax=Streptomyces katsurahamanus TaxID=2577098 RepID=A0ABW9NT33_9ACTN|nr:(2Fe-2S) ferredoxin domain-containing protein [Streptomyces katsurahamanus]MQS36311.1 (2Fe-2S) ferredoxin domain-containing protein [Streptomyces katsurahamanus]
MTTSAIRPFRTRPCTLVVCRGCCCGDARKHPGTDHDGQLTRLREAAAASRGRIEVRTTDCLGPCGQANVIVVQPSTEGRRRGARAAWIGWALDDDALDSIVAWALAGGPGLSEPPATLLLQTIPALAARR